MFRPPGLEREEGSPYDPVADFYQRGWADWYLPSVRPFLEKFFFSVLPGGASVLDVCCGCGHVTREAVRRGYRVTGIDVSEELIARAARDVPGASFLVADAREFQSTQKFDGALSTFDSLNHLLTYRDLSAAFCRIRNVLKPEAPFVFDMNLEEAYALDLGAWTNYRDENSIGFVRGRYSPAERRARTELIWFARTGDADCWKRSDALVEEQCYSREEIEGAVKEAGFRKLECYSASEVGIMDDLGYGRLYARAWT
jgi:SAM-dependent methyltransferase